MSTRKAFCKDFLVNRGYDEYLCVVEPSDYVARRNSNAQPDRPGNQAFGRNLTMPDTKPTAPLDLSIFDNLDAPSGQALTVPPTAQPPVAADQQCERHRAEARRVVDEHVEPAERGVDLQREAVRVVLVGDVTDDALRAGPGAGAAGRDCQSQPARLGRSPGFGPEGRFSQYQHAPRAW